MSPTTQARQSARVESLAPLRHPRGRVAAARGLVLLAALISFVLSVSLWFTGNEMEGIFVGIWVPSILALGAMIVPRPS